MDTKAAFEKWWEEEYSHLESSKYTDLVPHIKYGFFQAWQASREEIEIELPTEKTYRRDSSPILRAQSCGYNDAVADCEFIITSHGIRIKGKT